METAALIDDTLYHWERGRPRLVYYACTRFLDEVFLGQVGQH